MQQIESPSVPLSSPNTNDTLLLENEALPIPPLPGFDDLLGDESQTSSNTSASAETSESSQATSKNKEKQISGDNLPVKHKGGAKKSNVKDNKTEKVKPAKRNCIKGKVPKDETSLTKNTETEEKTSTKTTEDKEIKGNVDKMDASKIERNKKETKEKNLVLKSKDYPKRKRSKVFIHILIENTKIGYFYF